MEPKHYVSVSLSLPYQLTLAVRFLLTIFYCSISDWLHSLILNNGVTGWNATESFSACVYHARGWFISVGSGPPLPPTRVQPLPIISPQVIPKHCTTPQSKIWAAGKKEKPFSKKKYTMASGHFLNSPSSNRRLLDCWVQSFLHSPIHCAIAHYAHVLLTQFTVPPWDTSQLARNT